MAAFASGLYVTYLLTAFGLRSWMQWRATGSTGFRGVSDTPGSPEWWGGVLFVLAVALGAAAPLLQVADVLTPRRGLRELPQPHGRFMPGLR